MIEDEVGKLETISLEETQQPEGAYLLLRGHQMHRISGYDLGILPGSPEVVLTLMASRTTVVGTQVSETHTYPIRVLGRPHSWIDLARAILFKLEPSQTDRIEKMLGQIVKAVVENPNPDR